MQTSKKIFALAFVFAFGGYEYALSCACVCHLEKPVRERTGVMGLLEHLLQG